MKLIILFIPMENLFAIRHWKQESSISAESHPTGLPTVHEKHLLTKISQIFFFIFMFFLIQLHRLKHFNSYFHQINLLFIFHFHAYFNTSWWGITLLCIAYPVTSCDQWRQCGELIEFNRKLHFNCIRVLDFSQQEEARADTFNLIYLIKAQTVG